METEHDSAVVELTTFIELLSDIAILVRRSDGRLVGTNEAAIAAYGYTRDELLSLTIHNLRAPETLAQATAQMAQADADGLRFETIHLRKGGERFRVEVNSRGALHNGSRVLLSVVRDVSEKYRLLQALKEIEQRNRDEFQRNEDRLKFFKTAIDQAPLAAYWLDSTGRCIYVNDSACRMLGYSRDELLQLRIIDIARGSDELWQNIFESIKTRGSITLQSRHYRKDGEIVDVEITSFYLKYGDTDYSIGFASDISERLRAERERDQLQCRFNQAQKMESVGRLAGGVAHDFNNVLTIIQLSTQYILEHVTAEVPFYEDLTHIEKATRRAADLTRQLLTFARKQAIAPRVLNLNDTVEGLISMLGRLLGEDLELEWQPQPDVWPVSIDPSQLDQLLANLCVNARDAISDVGNVVIRTGNRSIDAVASAANPVFTVGDFVEISVSDDGCGMDAEMLSSIFDPFFSTKPEGKGTGLGLATVYGIVKQNGGFIDVSSEVGRGTTFSIYLPRFMGKCTSNQVPLPSPGMSVAAETILVVEDEPAILAMVTRMLKRRGYTVLAAQTPFEAIRTVTDYSGEIHLLLTDVILPEMNGRELSKQLCGHRPRLLSLFMSGYTADIIARHGVLEPDVSFIQKPFSVEEILTKVREVLDA